VISDEAVAKWDALLVVAGDVLQILLMQLESPLVSTVLVFGGCRLMLIARLCG
jgi:hypothetical protein